MLHRKRRMCICLLLFAAVAGCSSPSEPEGAWFTGEVVAVDVTVPSGGPPSIHLKEAVTDQCGIVFLVRKSTLIREQGGSPFSRAKYSDLSAGISIRVQARLVLDSCPAQSFADVIEIQR